MINCPDKTQKFHQLQLQLSSKGLLELYTWLHDTNSINRCDSVDLLRSTILAMMLANLDACKTPYVAVGDIIIPMTQEQLEEIAFGGERIMRTTKSNPSDYIENSTVCSSDLSNIDAKVDEVL